MKKISFLRMLVISLLGFALTFSSNIQDPPLMTYKVRELAPDLPNTTLGILGFIGLLVAMVVQPIIGVFSDRAKTMLGRRLPFIIGGAVLIAASLFLLVSAPALWVLLLGVIFNLTGFAVPEPIMKSVDLAGSAAVPVMLTILGFELARVTVESDRVTIGLATVAKLIVTPLIAFPLADVMGLQGVARAVCIVEASMPTAVLASIVAVEFDVRPKLVTGIVFVDPGVK